MDIAAFAAAHNLDKGALACLMVYLKDKLTGTPELAQAFSEATPEQRSQLIQYGVAQWALHSREWLTELYEGRTERAKAARAEIALQVWTEARQRAGLPT